MPMLPLHVIFCALLLTCIYAPATFALEKVHRGMQLLAFAADAPASDIMPTRAESALRRLAHAYDILIERSPASAQAIRTLRNHGAVMLIYYPGSLRSRRSLNSETVALYLPNFLEKRGKAPDGVRRFIVVVNHIGIRWPARELAGLIAHELIGHGGQHLRGQLTTSRPIDLECEASLHEEQAYQDLRLPKMDRAMVEFRKRLESHHCADFRNYMRRQRPARLRLWAPRDPDVAALLQEFDRYRRAQPARQGADRISRRNR